MMASKGPLWDRLVATAEQALRSGALVPLDTTSAILEDASGVNFSVRMLSNLQSSADPLFADLGAAFTVDNLKRLDFRLQAGSPAIDRGVFLTTATAGGSGTVVAVADPHYFIDGFGIVLGDEIQLEGQTASARIVSVDYAAKTLTLDQPLTFTAGQGVALKYSGKAPDIGAFER